MPRGPKKHLKRLNAPKHWMLDKLGGVFAPKPSPGPHKIRECLPLCLILRNRLKYALTYKARLPPHLEKLLPFFGVLFPAWQCICGGKRWPDGSGDITRRQIRRHVSGAYDGAHATGGSVLERGSHAVVQGAREGALSPLGAGFSL